MVLPAELDDRAAPVEEWYLFSHLTTTLHRASYGSENVSSVHTK